MQQITTLSLYEKTKSLHFLKSQMYRLGTFATYPFTAKISPLLLAEKGFVYVGNGVKDNVQCIFCGMFKEDWAIEADVQNIHAVTSPNCPMVSGRNCDNIPWTLSACTNPWSMIGYGPHGDVSQDSNTILTDGSSGEPSLSVTQNESGNAHSIMYSEDASRTTDRINSSKDETYSPHNDTLSFMGSTASFANSGSTINGGPESLITTVSHSTNVLSSDGTTSSSNPNRANSSRGPVNYPNSNSSNGPETQSSSINNNVSTTHENSSSLNGPGLHNSSISSGEPTILNNANSSSGPGPQSTSNRRSETATHNTSNSGSGPTYFDLGIVTERPKRIEYSLKQKRLETFASWPRDHHLTPNDLSNAGFYYAGYGDCSRCFFCGGGLRNWEDEDDVWVEHARWFPKCAFLRQKVGQRFIDVVQDLTKEFEQINLQMVMDKLPTFNFLNMQESTVKNDPAVQAVLELGYRETEVIEIAALLKEQSIPLSADVILDKLAKERNSPMHPMNNDLQLIDCTIQKNLETINKLKQSNNELRQRIVCKICLDQEVAVAFLPCGHLVSCTECSIAMKDCPLCRTFVKGIVRAFLN